jgi:hypothetical protein
MASFICRLTYNTGPAFKPGFFMPAFFVSLALIPGYFIPGKTCLYHYLL